MSDLRPERLHADLEQLARFGARGTGVSRPAFSRPYRAAADWLRMRMAEAGLAVRTDAAGNIIGRMGPADGPAVVCGSHIDSVPDGGRFDGTLGVLAALECARAMQAMGLPPKRALEVIAFADEEGAFTGLLGSRAMTGRVHASDVADATDVGGLRLFDAMISAGLDVWHIAAAGRPPSDFDCMIELHIEQGPVLEATGTAIGVVGSIVGLRLDEVSLEGRAAHAGTTPISARRDALRGAAEAISRCLDRIEQDGGDDARLTFGAVNVLPGASNVVPALVTATCEMRAANDTSIGGIAAVVGDVFADVAAARGLVFRRRELSYDGPASLCGGLAGDLRAAASSMGIGTQDMTSGASHDAQSFAGICPTAMIFVPSRAGVSHHPDEYTTPEQIEPGLRLLHAFLTARVLGRG